MVYSILFWCLAAICNAIMDTITHHWDESIFAENKGIITRREQWWNPDYSWKNKYVDKDPRKPIRKIFKSFDIPFTDAWHTFKSLMIIFLVVSLVFSWCSGPPLLNIWWVYLLDFILLGVIWNTIFNLFYNHLLKEK